MQFKLFLTSSSSSAAAGKQWLGFLNQLVLLLLFTSQTHPLVSISSSHIADQQVIWWPSENCLENESWTLMWFGPAVFRQSHHSNNYEESGLCFSFLNQLKEIIFQQNSTLCGSVLLWVSHHSCHCSKCPGDNGCTAHWWQEDRKHQTVSCLICLHLSICMKNEAMKSAPSANISTAGVSAGRAGLCRAVPGRLQR